MVSPWPRRIIYTTIGLGVVAALAYSFQPQPLAVDMAEVETGSLAVTLDGEGQTRVKDIYVVSAPVAGRKLRITKKVGEPVEANSTVLAAIEPSDPVFLDVRSTAEANARIKAAQAARTLAQAELKRYTAELDFARAELKRAEALVKRGTISKRDLERAELDMRTKEAAVSTARAALRVKNFDLEMAKAALIDSDKSKGGTGNACCVNVRAPINGNILRVVIESAAVVPAGAPLLEVGDPENLEIVVDLLSSDAVQVRLGDEVLIDDWGGGETLKGVVRLVEPAGFTKISALGIEEQRVNVLIDFAEPPARYQRLGHGFRVETRIVIWRGENILRVPMSALFREGDEWAVFAVRGKAARLQTLKIGKSNGEYAEVLEGLAAGDRVVQHPSDVIVDGSEVVMRGN